MTRHAPRQRSIPKLIRILRGATQMCAWQPENDMRHRQTPSASRTPGRFWRQLRRMNEREQAGREAMLILLAAFGLLVIGGVL